MTSARQIKFRIQAPRPRNPLVAAALQRKAGTHQKSAAALRRAEKVALKKMIRER
jgi:hypothetical protein